MIELFCLRSADITVLVANTVKLFIEHLCKLIWNVCIYISSKTKNINFNFPPKKGTGIERLIPFAPRDSVDLICKLCAYDADQRISAHQALKHVYFRELRSVYLLIASRRVELKVVYVGETYLLQRSETIVFVLCNLRLKSATLTSRMSIRI